MKRRMKTLSWRKDLKLNAARCSSGTHATVRFSQSNSRDKRLPREACFDLGDVKVENIVAFREDEEEDIPWRKDLKLNAARSQGHMPRVRFIAKNIVTSGSRVKRVLTRAMSKWDKDIVTFNEEEDEDYSRGGRISN